MPEEDAPLLVVDAGIGGLGTAVALGRRRIPYVLVEALPRPRAIDAGILLQHNTVHVLDALGVGEGLAAAARRVTGTSIRSVSIRSVSIRSVSGRLLAAVDPADVEGAAGAPALGIHRRDLHEALPARIPASALVTGDPACGFRTHPGGAELRLRSGRRLSGRGIVAADGIDSLVRSRLYGAQPAVRSGTTCLRGLTTAAAGEQDDGPDDGRDGRPDGRPDDRTTDGTPAPCANGGATDCSSASSRSRRAGPPGSRSPPPPS
ncbi:FAD-dependent oxidoreductase [Streptomyces xanthophaeus]